MKSGVLNDGVDNDGVVNDVSLLRLAIEGQIIAVSMARKFEKTGDML